MSLIQYHMSLDVTLFLNDTRIAKCFFREYQNILNSLKTARFLLCANLNFAKNDFSSKYYHTVDVMTFYRQPLNLPNLRCPIVTHFTNLLLILKYAIINVPN